MNLTKSEHTFLKTITLNLIMNNSNDWSFSLCDDSLELFDAIEEEVGDNDTTIHPKSDDSDNGDKCTPLNQYNPFYLQR